MGVEAAGIAGRVRHLLLPAADAAHGVGQQHAHVLELQQPLAGFLQGGEMRSGLEFDRDLQVVAVGQQRRRPAIVFFLELLEHQAGEQLRLGELLGRKLVRIKRQTALADRQGFENHPPW